MVFPDLQDEREVCKLEMVGDVDIRCEGAVGGPKSEGISIRIAIVGNISNSSPVISAFSEEGPVASDEIPHSRLSVQSYHSPLLPRSSCWTLDAGKEQRWAHSDIWLQSIVRMTQYES
jgi:hypothetical protein